LFIRELDAFDLKWNAFLEPFSTTLWITVLLLIFVSSICLAATCHVKRLYEMEEAEVFSVVTASFLTVGVFCLQGNLLVDLYYLHIETSNSDWACLSLTPSLSQCRFVYSVLTSQLNIRRIPKCRAPGTQTNLGPKVTSQIALTITELQIKSVECLLPSCSEHHALPSAFETCKD
jgi:hypothetical protein